MTHTYLLTGMTCTSCEKKVQKALESISNITHVVASKAQNTVTIGMTKQVSLLELQKVLDSKYQITTIKPQETLETAKSWLETYKPIVLIFFYICLVTALVQFTNHHFDGTQAMRHFMAGFFLVFSFFKLLNLKAFSESYAKYDIVAKKVPSWGAMYAFLELGLGVSYLVNFNPFFTNLVTFIVMSISIIGVLKSVLNKQKIQCACLGTVFNLPMSTITIIEDGLMIIMSFIMLLSFL